jgi:hypothetical protein
MRIRAHVLTPSNNTIASSMIESLRWCHKSMRAGHKIVIIQFRPMPGRNHFSGPTKTSRNKRLRTWLSTKQGWPACNSFSISFGTSHAAGSSPLWMCGGPSNDRALSNDPRFGQRGHLRRPCAGCLPHRLGSQRRPHRPTCAPSSHSGSRNGHRNDRPPPGGLLLSRLGGLAFPERPVNSLFSRHCAAV